MTFATKWTKEHDEFLTKKREEGHSSSQIAVLLYDEFRINHSRNAVIGRAHRLGLTKSIDVKPKVKFTASPKRHRKELASPEESAERPKPPAIKTKTLKFGGWAHNGESLTPDPTPLRAADVVPLNLTLFELNHDTCRWPYGGWPTDEPITFCGHTTLDKESYCEAHRQLSRGRGTISERLATLVPKCEAA